MEGSVIGYSNIQETLFDNVSGKTDVLKLTIKMTIQSFKILYFANYQPISSLFVFSYVIIDIHCCF